MAKISAIKKNEKRKQLSQKWEAYRRFLRERVVDAKISDEERYEAHLKLQKLPRNTSRVRTRSRCFVTGRPRGGFQKFGLSRIAFRQMALEGKLPGVTKASW